MHRAVPGGVGSRLARIACGYCLACLAISYSGLILLLPLVVIARMHGENTDDLMLGLRYYASFAPLLAVSVGAWALAPAALAIAYAEARRMRSVWFCLAAGSLIAILCFTAAEAWIGLFRLSERWPASFQMRSAAGLGLLAVILGTIGGHVYWAIAGRSAGAWRGRPEASTDAGRVVSGAR
ncbi:MAG TPA: hypothetical protein VFZ16_22380 [Hyphomicrobiaceae bacterium]|jgi:hypothetical protein|nr:hypothetical protein [Hyphomicrobiaceae bacterium]